MTSIQSWPMEKDLFIFKMSTLMLNDLFPLPRKDLQSLTIEEEEYQYMIAGYDFVLDLLGLLDLFKPLVDLMLRVQSLNTPIWKLKQWWPILKSEMQCMIDNDDFSTLKQYGTLNPGDNFKGVTSLDGWLLEEAEGKFVFYIFLYLLKLEELQIFSRFLLA